MAEDKSDEHLWRSLRLPGWDYRSAGAYFVTLVTHNRELLLGTVRDGAMTLTPYGEIVQREWVESANIRREIKLDTFVVMPNHLHGVVWIVEPDEPKAESLTVKALNQPTLPPRVRPKGPKAKSLGAFMAGFKATATRLVNERRGTPGAPLWQRNYYERIIRNERELDAIRAYIETNPVRWAEDEDNPERK